MSHAEHLEQLAETIAADEAIPYVRRQAATAHIAAAIDALHPDAPPAAPTSRGGSLISGALDRAGDSADGVALGKIRRTHR